MTPHETDLDDLVTALLAVPGVTDAAAAVRESVVLHRAQTSEPGADPEPPPDAADRPAAEVYGGDLPDDPGGAATLREALSQAAALAGDIGITYARLDGTRDFQSYASL